MLVIVLVFPLGAQQVFELGEETRLRVAGELIPMPFAVGINAAQFQQIDMDGDGLEEWVAWDINSRRILVFSEENDRYSYDPKGAYSFPTDVSGFLRLADYDGDGRKDLFTSSPFGIKVYRNISESTASAPEWVLAQNFLRLDNGSNLQANNLDIPLIKDLDGDGDLDIVTFNFASGDYLEYYQNTSIERKGVADVDGFAFPVSQWGDFVFCGCGQFSFGISCSGVPFGRTEAGDRVLHAGGHSILYEDFDGDGNRDLLLGRDECGSLYYLPNVGGDVNPVFDRFSQELPGYGPLPQFPIFHGAFLDRPRLIVSSNTSEFSAIYQADFSKNVFELLPSENGIPSSEVFLQDQMLDLGESSRPFFNGLKEQGALVVTANSLMNGRVVGTAYRFDWAGDEWALEERDYLGLSEWDLLEMQYLEFSATGGPVEYWISGIDTVNSLLQRRVWVGSSVEKDLMQEVVFQGTGIRTLDHVELFSYDNHDFLLLSRQTGELVLFQVNREDIVSLELVERNFLGFSDNPARRNLSVHVIPGAKPSMYFVDQRGELGYLRDFMGESEQITVQISLSQTERVATRLSRSSWISSLPDAFGEGHDLIIGNTAGGLEYLSGQAGGSPDPRFSAKVYPNPSQGEFFILTSGAARARLVNSLGQVLIEGIEIPAKRPIQIVYPYMAIGLYIIQIESLEGAIESRKIWVNQ